MSKSLELLEKPLLQSVFFTDYLNHETVNITTCRPPSANPLQLWAHYLKSFRTVAIIFLGFRDFLIYPAKHF